MQDDVGVRLHNWLEHTQVARADSPHLLGFDHTLEFAPRLRSNSVASSSHSRRPSLARQPSLPLLSEHPIQRSPLTATRHSARLHSISSSLSLISGRNAVYIDSEDVCSRLDELLVSGNPDLEFSDDRSEPDYGAAEDYYPTSFLHDSPQFRTSGVPPNTPCYKTPLASSSQIFLGKATVSDVSRHELDCGTPVPPAQLLSAISTSSSSISSGDGSASSPLFLPDSRPSSSNIVSTKPSVISLLSPKPSTSSIGLAYEVQSPGMLSPPLHATAAASKWSLTSSIAGDDKEPKKKGKITTRKRLASILNKISGKDKESQQPHQQHRNPSFPDQSEQHSLLRSSREDVQGDVVDFNKADEELPPLPPPKITKPKSKPPSLKLTSSNSGSNLRSPTLVSQSSSASLASAPLSPVRPSPLQQVHFNDEIAGSPTPTSPNYFVNTPTSAMTCISAGPGLSTSSSNTASPSSMPHTPVYVPAAVSTTASNVDPALAHRPLPPTSLSKRNGNSPVLKNATSVPTSLPAWEGHHNTLSQPHAYPLANTNGGLRREWSYDSAASWGGASVPEEEEEEDRDDEEDEFEEEALYYVRELGIQGERCEFVRRDSYYPPTPELEDVITRGGGNERLRDRIRNRDAEREEEERKARLSVITDMLEKDLNSKTSVSNFNFNSTPLSTHIEVSSMPNSPKSPTSASYMTSSPILAPTPSSPILSRTTRTRGSTITSKSDKEKDRRQSRSLTTSPILTRRSVSGPAPVPVPLPSSPHPPPTPILKSSTTTSTRASPTLFTNKALPPIVTSTSTYTPNSTPPITVPSTPQLSHQQPSTALTSSSSKGGFRGFAAKIGLSSSSLHLNHHNQQQQQPTWMNTPPPSAIDNERSSYFGSSSAGISTPYLSRTNTPLKSVASMSALASPSPSPNPNPSSNTNTNTTATSGMGMAKRKMSSLMLSASSKKSSATTNGASGNGRRKLIITSRNNGDGEGERIKEWCEKMGDVSSIIRLPKSVVKKSMVTTPTPATTTTTTNIENGVGGIEDSENVDVDMDDEDLEVKYSDTKYVVEFKKYGHLKVEEKVGKSGCEVVIGGVGNVEVSWEDSNSSSSSPFAMKTTSGGKVRIGGNGGVKSTPVGGIGMKSINVGGGMWGIGRKKNWLP